MAPFLFFDVESRVFVAMEAMRSTMRLRRLFVFSSSLFSNDWRWRFESSVNLEIFESMLAPMSLVCSGSISLRRRACVVASIVDAIPCWRDTFMSACSRSLYLSCVT